MSKRWQLRLAVLVTGILVMIVLVIWAAFANWRLTSRLEVRFATVEQEIFHFADRSHQTLLRLNNLMLRYQFQPDPAFWEDFEQTSQFLENWMEAKKTQLPTTEERRIQGELAAAYQEYLGAARLIHAKLISPTATGGIIEENRLFESQAKRVLGKISELATAHRLAQQQLLAEFNASLSRLQLLLIVALAIMVASTSGLAWLVSRDLIAPLRLQLSESKALIERQEKLASLGILAAGVAHEIRNPLTAIKARLFTLRKGLKIGSRELADAEVIGQEINRLERIVKDFLLFARPSDPQLRTVAAAEPLGEIESLMRPQLEKAGVQLILEPSPPAWVRVDPEQIKQVLMNLVQNAAEAVSANGRVILRTRRAQASLKDGVRDVVILEVEDNGKGIPPEAQKRLFDPFFSTKEAGTGLGLSIAARLVEKQGGLLHFQTQPEQGTTFSIILPETKAP